MRNMSFSLTTEQVRNKTNTVTRRLGWYYLLPGDRIQAVEKCQGLKKGEKIKRICEIEVVSAVEEKLVCMDESDLAKEGFPNMTLYGFWDMFCKANKCSPDTYVNRIEFKYVEVKK